VGVRLVRDPPAAVDASHGEEVDEVAAEVVGLDQHRDTGVAHQIDGPFVGHNQVVQDVDRDDRAAARLG
jgi:hypothetical protein